MSQYKTGIYMNRFMAQVPLRTRFCRYMGAELCDTVFTFGKHRGRTYKDVKANEPGYCQWALQLNDPSENFAGFLRFLRESQPGCSNRPEKSTTLGQAAAVVKPLLYDGRKNFEPSHGAPNGVPPSRCGVATCNELPPILRSDAPYPDPHLQSEEKGISYTSSLSSPSRSGLNNARSTGTWITKLSSMEHVGRVQKVPTSPAKPFQLAQSQASDTTSFDYEEAFGDNTSRAIREKLDLVVFLIIGPNHFALAVPGRRKILSGYLGRDLYRFVMQFKHMGPDYVSRASQQKPAAATGPPTSPYVPVPVSAFPLVRDRLPQVNKIEPIPPFILAAFPSFLKHIPGPTKVNAKTAAVLLKEGSQEVTEVNFKRLVGPKLLEALKPFQLEGISFGLTRSGRVLIADEMGLGKTLQGLGIAAAFYSEWPLLIITPSSIRFQWREQLLQWLGHLVRPHEIDIVKTGKSTLDFCNTKIVIASYSLLKNEALRNFPFQTVIVDESHYLKNASSQRASIMIPIIRRAKRAVLLSGTPALNKPTELFPQLESLMPGFATFQQFASRFCEQKLNPWSRKVEFSDARLSEELNAFLNETVMIRRLKRDVQSQLPPKMRSRISVECAPRELAEIKKLSKLHSLDLETKKGRSLYDIFGDMSKNGDAGDDFLDRDGKNRVDTKSALAALFQLSGVGKVPAVCDHVDYLLENSCKFLLFGHHVEVLDRVEEHLKKSSPGHTTTVQTPNLTTVKGHLPVGPTNVLLVQVKYVRIDGSVTEARRETACKTFQEDSNCKVAILSITACSHGLNLTAAGTVVFAELYWVPGVMIQAEDRSHRMGTTYETIAIHYLIGQGTIDEVMWRLMQKKWSIVSATLDGKNEVYAAAETTVAHASRGNKKLLLESQPDVDSMTQPEPTKTRQFGATLAKCSPVTHVSIFDKARTACIAERSFRTESKSMADLLLRECKAGEPRQTQFSFAAPLKTRSRDTEITQQESVADSNLKRQRFDTDSSEDELANSGMTLGKLRKKFKQEDATKWYEE